MVQGGLTVPLGEERKVILEKYGPYVRSLAATVRKQFNSQIEMDELMAYGQVGLLEAAERFDPKVGANFLTFAHYRIKGAIFDGLRQMGILTRTPNDAWVRREAALNDLVQTASDDELENPATSVDDEIQTIEKFVDSLIPAYLLSLSEENAPDVADSRDLPNVAVEFKETMQIVRETVNELPEKEKEIIESLYFKHLSTTELAKQMGVNKSWVSRLHSKAVNRLRQRLALIGVLSNE